VDAVPLVVENAALRGGSVMHGHDEHNADEWDERYAGQDDGAPTWSGGANGTLVAEVADLAPGTVLDVGSGEGGDAIWLARQGWQVTAAEPSRHVDDIVLRARRLDAPGRAVGGDRAGPRLGSRTPAQRRGRRGRQPGPGPARRPAAAAVATAAPPGRGQQPMVCTILHTQNGGWSMRTAGYATGHTYQVSDLQRQYRRIVGDARTHGALIRDKDGTTLTLVPTDVYDRATTLVGYIPTLVQLEHVLRQPGEARHVTAFGPVAWAAALDEDDLTTFVHEFADTLLVAASGGPLDAIEDLLHDWRITAEALADEDLVDELLADADEPLADVEL
jgi:hypothetical protein